MHPRALGPQPDRVPIPARIGRLGLGSAAVDEKGAVVSWILVLALIAVGLAVLVLLSLGAMA